GFNNSSRPTGAANRFGVEVPVLDPSAAATIDLAALLLAATAAGLKQRPGGGGGAAAAAPANWTVVHAREDALAAAVAAGGAKGRGGGAVLGLRQACQRPQLGGLLLVVEPAVSDVALVEQLLDEVWVGPAAVILNPQWAQQGPAGAAATPAEFERLVGSIAVLYSFLPCAIQAALTLLVVGRKRWSPPRLRTGGGGGAVRLAGQ
ncbi:hypothetical protein TSOC_015016, partial [Tetrabaena socialis]